MLRVIHTYEGNRLMTRDYRGDVRCVIDDAGTLEESTSYYPYGMPHGTGLLSSVQPYKYTGKELDRETGLDWYDSQARMYDPTLIVTTTMDPMAEKYYPMSPYLWCGGNPVKYQDPNGELIVLNMSDEQIDMYNSYIELLRQSKTFNQFYQQLEESKSFTMTITMTSEMDDNEVNTYNAQSKLVTVQQGGNLATLAEELYHGFQDFNQGLTDDNSEFEAKTATSYILGEAGLPNGCYATQYYFNEIYYIGSDNENLLDSDYFKDNYITIGNKFADYHKENTANVPTYYVPVKMIPKTLYNLFNNNY